MIFRFKLRFFYIVFFILGVLLISGCRKQEQPEVSDTDGGIRIVSLAPSHTEILFALGLEEHIVGVTSYCNYPPEAKTLPQIGSYTDPDIERIIAQKPTLILADPVNSPAVISQLKRLERPVYLLTMNTIDEFFEVLGEIGRLTEAEKAAQGLIDSLKAEMQEAQEQIPETGALRPRVLFVLSHEPIIIAGADTFIHDLLLHAGSENAAERISGYKRISKEDVIALNPDIIIETSMNTSISDAERKAVHAFWSEIRYISAVKNERIYLITPDVVNRPGPRFVIALEKLIDIIYPESEAEEHETK